MATALTFCGKCGAQLTGDAVACDRCGAPRGEGLGSDQAMRWILPVGRSSWAIAAGYLGLFAVLIVPAPLALAAGIMAMRDISANPTRQGMGRAIFGLVMGLIFSAVLVFLLIALLAPAATKV